jgi:hypothetical protein
VWPGSEKIAVTTPRFVSSIDLPYGKRSTIRSHEDGFFAGTASAPQIDEYDANGTLTASIRWSAKPIAIAGNEIDAWRDRFEQRMTGAPAEFVTAFKRAVEIARFPAARPPYRTFLVADDGRLWVERVNSWNAERAAAVWDVFDAQGQWLSVVRVPSGAVLLDVRADRLLASWEDEEGVPHIRVYALSPSASGRAR